MKRLLPAAVLGLLLLGSGCATVNHCREGDRSVVDITNTGWYLLNFIPLASGNPAHPNAFGCKIFRQTVTLENNMTMLENELERLGATSYRNIISHTADENILFILFKRHSCHTSAELVFDGAPEGKLPCVSPNQ